MVGAVRWLYIYTDENFYAVGRPLPVASLCRDTRRGVGDRDLVERGPEATPLEPGISHAKLISIATGPYYRLEIVLAGLAGYFGPRSQNQTGCQYIYSRNWDPLSIRVRPTSFRNAAIKSTARDQSGKLKRPSAIWIAHSA